MNKENEKAVQQLKDVRQWAKAKIDTGEEPPWAWFQYMKLIETADAILAAIGCVTTTENLQQSEQLRDTHLRLVDSKYQQDNTEPQLSNFSVNLPM